MPLLFKSISIKNALKELVIDFKTAHLMTNHKSISEPRPEFNAFKYYVWAIAQAFGLQHKLLKKIQALFWAWYSSFIYEKNLYFCMYIQGYKID